MQTLNQNSQFEQAKYYDSRGIIPGPEEGLQYYLRRSSKYLGELQGFYDDIKGKKAIIKSENEGLDRIISIGDYIPLDNISMTNCGFLELYFPVGVVDDDVFDQTFEEDKLRPIEKHIAFKTSVLYSGRYIPLIIFTNSSLKDYLDIQGTDYSEFEEDMSPFDFDRKFKAPERFRNAFIGHENIHAIRERPIPRESGHFEEIVALSTSSNKTLQWENYMAMTMNRKKFSWQHPLRSIDSARDYNYFCKIFEEGVAEQFPLPLLVRISFKEFKDISKQIISGIDIERILENRYSTQSPDSWRWQIIAEHCGF